MPTVRCPSCWRALSVAEGAVGKSVRCPMCERVFDAPSVEQERAPRGAPPPARISTSPGERPSPSTSVPVGPPVTLDPDLRAALRCAARWLTAAGALQVALVACWWGLAGSGRVGGLLGLYLLLGAARAGALAAAAACADRLRRRREARLVRVTATVVACDSCLLAVAAVPPLLDVAELIASRSNAPDVPVLAGYLVLVAAAVACGLTAAVQALRLVGRPDVRRAFE
jgi:hypothetical protein